MDVVHKKNGIKRRLRWRTALGVILIGVLVAASAAPALVSAADSPPIPGRGDDRGARPVAFAEQRRQLESIQRLIEINDGDLPPAEKVQQLAEQASIEQARQLGVGLESEKKPPEKEWTAAAFHRLISDRYGDGAILGGMGNFRRLSGQTRRSLAETVVAFFAFEDSVREASGRASSAPHPPGPAQGRIIEPILSARLELLRRAGDLRRALDNDGGARDLDGQQRSSNSSAAASSSSGPVPMRLAATGEAGDLDDACWILVEEKIDIESGRSQVPPLRGPICINPTRSDDVYQKDYGLLIDAGGSDTYKNNAGGGSGYVDPFAVLTPHRVRAGALIDLGIEDDYYINSCGQPLASDPVARTEGCRNGGVNGGGGTDTGEKDPATYGAGFLLDQGGSDRYVGGERGVNGGGGNSGAVGFLFDGGGPDFYFATGRGVNGGGRGGVGLLIDTGGGNDGDVGDAYSAHIGEGANGGATDGQGTYGAGFLLDTGGNDEHFAGGKGVNGGAFGFSQGLLVDLDGHDKYGGQDDGANGGASRNEGGFGDTPAGFLFDGNGDDRYIAGSRGTNGGAFFKGGVRQGAASGLLLDLRGEDTYSAGKAGVNGGAEAMSLGGASGPLVPALPDPGEPFSFVFDLLFTFLFQLIGNVNQAILSAESPAPAVGLLWDGLGDDKYADLNDRECGVSTEDTAFTDCKGTGSNRTVAPKGTLGLQVDSTSESEPPVNRPGVGEPALGPPVPERMPTGSPTGDDPLGDGVEQPEPPERPRPEPPGSVDVPVESPNLPGLPDLPSEGTGGTVFLSGHQGIVRLAGEGRTSFSAFRPTRGNAQQNARDFLGAALRSATGGKTPARVLLLPYFDLFTNQLCNDYRRDARCETKGDDEEHKGMENIGYKRCSVVASPTQSCYDYAIDLQAWYHCPQDKAWDTANENDRPATNDRCKRDRQTQSMSSFNQRICHGTGGTGYDGRYTFVKPHEDFIRYCEGAKDLNSVEFSDYDAVVVSTTWPGDLWKLEDRREDLYQHVNTGGGLVMFGQSYGTLPENYRGTSRTNDGSYYRNHETMRRVLRFVKDMPYGLDAVAAQLAGGSSVTTKGREAGLTDNSVSATFQTLWFMESCGFDVLEVDPFDRIVTMAGNQKFPPDCSGITVDPVSVVEGDSGTKDMTFEVRLISTKPGEQSFDFTTMDATASTEDNDYIPAKGTITFPAASAACPATSMEGGEGVPCNVRSPGEQRSHHDSKSQSIAIKVVGDRKPETDEVLLLKFTDRANGTVQTVTLGTIVDDDNVDQAVQALVARTSVGSGEDDLLSGRSGDPADAASSALNVGGRPPLPIAVPGASSAAAIQISLPVQVPAGGPATAQASTAAQAQVTIPQAVLMRERELQQQLQQAKVDRQGGSHVEYLAAERQSNPSTPIVLAGVAGLAGIVGAFAVRRRPQISLAKEFMPDGNSRGSGMNLVLRRVHGQL